MKKMIIIILLMLFVVGCTSYYKVTDPATEKTYYTTEVKYYKNSGSVDIKDGKTGARVVLPSSEMKKISEDEYKRAIYSDHKN